MLVLIKRPGSCNLKKTSVFGLGNSLPGLRMPEPSKRSNVVAGPKVLCWLGPV